MGNLRAFGGPLSDEWIDAQAALQRRILARQRALGMQSVLPGFAGFVPDALSRVHPNAKIEPSTQWWETANASLCCNRLLRPDEPLWTRIGVRFYELLIEAYGSGEFDYYVLCRVALICFARSFVCLRGFWKFPLQ